MMSYQTQKLVSVTNIIFLNRQKFKNSLNLPHMKTTWVGSTISGMMIYLCIINLLCEIGVKVTNNSSVIEHLMKI